MLGYVVVIDFSWRVVSPSLMARPRRLISSVPLQEMRLRS